MFKTNEYFDGKVKSISFTSEKGPATIGVMATGTHEFVTSGREFITVISGEMDVQLSGSAKWKKYVPFQNFIMEKNEKFQVRLEVETAYLCIYDYF